MPSKKAIIGISIIGILLIVAALPLIIYGTSVDTVEVDMDLSISGSNPIPSSIELQANGDDLKVDYQLKKMNAYEYALMRMTGDRVKIEEKQSIGDSIVDIDIVFNLETPSGKKLDFSFSPGQSIGTGDSSVKVTLGPEDLTEETGTFILSITISIKITPPAPQAPTIERELTPVSLEFEVPV